MTKEQLAAKLNGREYGYEITDQEVREAKTAGLLVIFGYSDDNAEFRGAFSDEKGCYNGALIFIHRAGVLDYHDDDECECTFCGYPAAVKKCARIESEWCKEAGYSWTFKTAVQHATFDIMEDGKKFCRGLVVDVRDLPANPTTITERLDGLVAAIK